MTPKQCLTWLGALALCAQLTAQSSFANENAAFVITHSQQIQALQEATDALALVRKNYLTTIQQATGTDRPLHVAQQQQYDWMTQIAPAFLSTIEKKKKLAEKMNACVNEFGATFSLTQENQAIINERLTILVDAYKKYTTAYSTLYEQWNNGKPFVAVLPPPPPPSQQHHRN